MSATATDHLLIERDGPVTVLTMNRPNARNAFSPQMLVRLEDAWIAARSTPGDAAIRPSRLSSPTAT